MSSVFESRIEVTEAISSTGIRTTKTAINPNRTRSLLGLLMVKRRQVCQHQCSATYSPERQRLLRCTAHGSRKPWVYAMVVG